MRAFKKRIRYLIHSVVCVFALSPSFIFAGEWEHITHCNDQEIDLVFTVKKKHDGSVLFGGNTGLYEANGNDINKISDLYSSYFAIDADDNAYVSISSEIIKISKVDDAYIETSIFKKPDSMPFLIKLAVDSQNNIWGTSYIGVYRIENETDYEHFDISSGLYDNYIYNIHIDSHDRVWICYGDPVLPNENTNNFGGVSVYSDNKWTTYNESDGLLSNRVYCIESNSTSVLLSYTGRGISAFTDSTWSLISEIGGYNLCTDNKDTIWYHLSKYKLLGYLRDDGTTGTIEEMPSITHYYDLAVDHNGTIWVGTTDGILKYTPLDTSVNSATNTLDAFDISVHPNPFNPSTTISYTISEQDNVKVSIFNLSGQKAATLVNSSMPAGTHHAVFDGSNLASGIYFYRLEVGSLVTCGKMTLIK